MKVIKTIAPLRKVLAQYRKRSKTIGFVPTMGYLHAGHLSLFRKSKSENDITVVSIFVNPKQFGPHEDYACYPRDKKHDETLAKKENVDIIFCPSDKIMYPTGYLTYVETVGLSNKLCGQFRPEHFRGVATVVAKLLNIVNPNTLYLGQKDLQQATILKRMVEDLNFPVKVKICPTIRENDGLAMSSRNTYLKNIERQKATALFKALGYARGMIRKGERRSGVILSAIRTLIRAVGPRRIDYIDCVNTETLEPLSVLKGQCAIAVAVWFGKTRLIDNIVVKI